jgi:hypothetical protein
MANGVGSVTFIWQMLALLLEITLKSDIAVDFYAGFV